MRFERGTIDLSATVSSRFLRASERKVFTSIGQGDRVRVNALSSSEAYCRCTDVNKGINGKHSGCPGRFGMGYNSLDGPGSALKNVSQQKMLL